MYKLNLIRKYVFLWWRMNYPIFFRLNSITQEFEFNSPDVPEINFTATSIEEGYEQARSRLIQHFSFELIEPSPIRLYFDSEKLKDEKFFIVNLDPSHFEDVIEKVTITSPKKLLKRIEDAIVKNPTLKSRSAFLVKAAEDLLRKEEAVYMLKDINVTSLSSLTQESPAYYFSKLAYVHHFIEHSKNRKRNYIDLLIHNLTENDVRTTHPTEFPLRGDRICLKDGKELVYFLNLLKKEYVPKGFKIEEQKILENGTFRYWLYRITWDPKNAPKFLDTNLNFEDFVWSEKFVKAYLETRGFVVNSEY